MNLVFHLKPAPAPGAMERVIERLEHVSGVVEAVATSPEAIAISFDVEKVGDLKLQQEIEGLGLRIAFIDSPELPYTDTPGYTGRMETGISQEAQAARLTRDEELGITRYPIVPADKATDQS